MKHAPGKPQRRGLWLTLATLLLIALSVSVGYLLAKKQIHANTATGAPASPKPAERRVLYWYDPMAPNQHFDKPGKSPFMDMELQAKYADEDTPDSASGVRIEPTVTQNLGLRLATAERGALAASVQASAIVTWNERQVALAQTKSAGFVERVYDLAPGDVVAAGAPLADLLIADWAGAQTEFLALLKTHEPGLIVAAKQRLELLGMSKSQIERVAKSGKVTIHTTLTAPLKGVIQTLDVRSGMTLAAGQTLAKINGLDPVWLEAAVPEAEAAPVTVGERITAHFAAWPERSISGRVISVLPEINADSRSLRVRVELPNPEGRLRPGMFAAIRFAPARAKESVLIPATAVIRTGKRSIVMLAQEGGRYQPVEVRIGQEVDGKIAVLEGLTVGQKVVTSGQFLLDSEASLQGIAVKPLPLITAPPATAAAALGAAAATAAPMIQPMDHGNHGGEAMNHGNQSRQEDSDSHGKHSHD